ncbi:MAG: hypothetical protein JXD22_12785 [Sedimentisphaerales bacterium]|nr:hypothetical protein [Sedimentisphaerales bacterium]
MSNKLSCCLILVLLVTLMICARVDAVLQVHLEMENNLSDSAGTADDGTMVDGSLGTHGYVTGRIGQALELGNLSGDPGSTQNDYVSLDYVLADEGSVSFWFYTDAMYDYQTLFDNSVDANDWEMWIYSDARLRFRVQDTAIVTCNLNTKADDGTAEDEWFHIAVTWEKDGTNVNIQLFVNGELIEQNSGPWVAPGSQVYLGGGNSGNDAGTGLWDDFRIYDHPLAESEVKWLALRGLSFDPVELETDEGDSTSYEVVLDYPPAEVPTDDVLVTIIPNPSQYVSLNSQGTGQNITLTFESGSYDIPQTVQFQCIDDSEDNDNQIIELIHHTSSNDSDWNILTDQTLSLLIYDDDIGCGDWGYFPADLDRNCYVNLVDFSMFAQQWLTCTVPNGQDCLNLNKIKIVAHRGYSAIAPENTIASSNAARGFAHMVEFDVRPTSDGQLILMHDTTVDRTTDGTGTPPSMTFAQIRALDAGSWFSSEFTGELVPLMSEAILAVLPDMIPCIERKDGTAQQYYDILQALRIKYDVVIIAFNWSFLADLNALDPKLKLGALGSGTLNSSTIATIKASGADFIDWSHSGITATEVDLVHAEDMELFLWTINDSARMQELIDWGVDGITTDNPALLQELLESY